MKLVKSILVALFITAGFTSFAQNTITATEAHITITAATTRQDLAQLRTDLLAQGIDFRYNPQFDGQRNIIAITYTITANNGAITGSGQHMSLKAPNASLTFHVNKTAGTCTFETVGAPSQQN